MGPPLLTPRCRHSSCTIQSDDGSTKCIIIIGGWTDEEENSKSTEILYVADQKWVQGPNLPVGIRSAACVALPPTSNFACVVVGGYTLEDPSSGEPHLEDHHWMTIIGPPHLDVTYPNVYGLDTKLMKWTLLGEIRTSRTCHIALPIS